MKALPWIIGGVVVVGGGFAVWWFLLRKKGSPVGLGSSQIDSAPTTQAQAATQPASKMLYQPGSWQHTYAQRMGITHQDLVQRYRVATNAQQVEMRVSGNDAATIADQAKRKAAAKKKKKKKKKKRNWWDDALDIGGKVLDIVL